MNELDRLILEYKAEDMAEDKLRLLIEMLRMERSAARRLIDDLKVQTFALDTACAHANISACTIKQDKAIRALINDNTQ